MDPLSITASIAGVLTIAFQTLQLVNTYVSEVRNDKDAVRVMATKLDTLHSNLKRLDMFLKDGSEAGRGFEHTSALVTSATACRDNLTVLHEILDNKLSGHKRSLMSSLKWPLNVDNHRKTLEELEAFSTCVQMALTIDGFALLSKSIPEVQEVLKKEQEILAKQKDSFEFLVKLDYRLDYRDSLMEEAFEKQARSLDEGRRYRERNDVLNWLSPVNHTLKHHHIRKSHVNGTGEWLLHMEEFVSWRDEPQPRLKILCCYGHQGTGKSVLASLVIDRLTEYFTNGNVVIAYFYFDYREPDCNERGHQLAEAMLASLLKQLAILKSELPRPLLGLYQRMTRQQRQPQQEDLEETLLLAIRDFTRVFVVIDALDECEKNQRKAVLRALGKLSECSPVSIFVTSRPHPQDVQKVFEKYPKITVEGSPPDIRKYVNHRIGNSDDPDAFDEKFKNLIVEKISIESNQMFLLAVLQVQAILNEPTVGDMKEALGKMPRGLNDALDSTLSRIQNQAGGRERVGLTTLMWISHAKRPLLVNEISEALAIRSGDRQLNPDNRPRPGILLDCCMGLVTVDEESFEVRLVHLSVQEYLLANRTRFFPHAEKIIAEACITYSMFDVFGEGMGYHTSGSEIEGFIGKHPFLTYASRYWGYHVQSADNEEVDDLALDFLRSQKHLTRSHQLIQFVRGRKERYWEPKEASSCTPSILAAFFGLPRLLKRLFDYREAVVDEATNLGTTALMKAAAQGHHDAVDLLLSRGADLNKQNWYGSSLHCTAEDGNATCISQLITAGYNVDTRDRFGRTSLHCATLSGQLDTIKALLRMGADVNAQCNSDICDGGCSPLHYAVICEYPIEILRTLLENGARVDNLTSTMLTPLHHAAELDLQETAELLLNYGADVNARAFNGGTPLHFAASNNCTKIVQILLEHGADNDAQSDDGVTPIWVAAEHGCEQTVRLLARARGLLKYDNTAPDFELDNGSEDPMQLLLEDVKDNQDVQDSTRAIQANMISLIRGGGSDIQRFLAEGKRLSDHSNVRLRARGLSKANQTESTPKSIDSVGIDGEAESNEKVMSDDEMHEKEERASCFSFDIDRHSASPPRYNSGIMTLSQIRKATEEAYLGRLLLGSEPRGDE